MYEGREEAARKEESRLGAETQKWPFVLLGMSLDRSQCSSNSEMVSLTKHNSLFALSRCRGPTLHAGQESREAALESGGEIASQAEGVNLNLVDHHKYLYLFWFLDVANPFIVFLPPRNGMPE